MVGPPASPGLDLGEVLLELELADVVPQEAPDPHGEVVVAVDDRVLSQDPGHPVPDLGAVVAPQGEALQGGEGGQEEQQGGAGHGGAGVLG